MQNYAANANVLFVLAFLFNESFLTQTEPTAARLPGFLTPVETFTPPRKDGALNTNNIAQVLGPVLLHLY